MGYTSGFSRRQLLKLGVTAAGATIAPIAWPRAGATQAPATVDHARAAQHAYR